MYKSEKKTYTVKFIDSLKKTNYELPKKIITSINNIDKELNKFFKFLIDNKTSNSKNIYKKYNEQDNKQKRNKLLYKEGDEDKINVEREINLILNKINIKNYEAMKEVIINKCKKKETIEYMVESMFQKSVSQPGFCECYVKLYKDLISIEDGSKDYLVTNIISDKCDRYLDIFEGNQENNINDTHKNDYDKFCELVKQKEYIKGYSQFIGELHNNEIIGINKINIFINTILKNINKNKIDNVNIEEYINSLYTIIKCIGNKFYNIDDYQEKKNIFIEYCKDNQLTPKNKFKFMDICDLLK